MTPQQWLQSERDYETGRRIYEALGSNAHLKRTLSSGPNSYNREALAYEVGKLAKAGVQMDVLPAIAPVLPVLSRTAPAPPALAPEPADADPLQEQVLQELATARPPLYDERRYLHAQLAGLPTDADRLQAARRIQAISRQLNESWAATAYVKEHGHLPVPESLPFDVKNGTLAELIGRRANLRSCISKWKKKPARAADLAAAQVEEQALSARIEQLKGEEVNRG
ncbi:hypothetical protein [Hymenobacter pini]|uniref:hypothetical protein n=1 Tax=Hymenobacter pini TaxID=2880879 RepID=UPI001CF5F029|nr:hypothetical protein [Hymenobacter pini]MCA8830176.1 hypothetical protein [Hymenobacter pini]